jgi:hypothetical protein
VVNGDSVDYADSYLEFTRNNRPSKIVSPTHRAFQAKRVNGLEEISSKRNQRADLDEICLTSSCEKSTTNDSVISETTPCSSRPSKRKIQRLLFGNETVNEVWPKKDVVIANHKVIEPIYFLTCDQLVHELPFRYKLVKLANRNSGDLRARRPIMQTQRWSTSTNLAELSWLTRCVE